MRILVTGATGVIGRRLVPLLSAAGHEVTGVARSRSALDALERGGARGLRLDLFDAAAVRRAVAGHAVVVNLATHIPRSSVAMGLPWAWHENDRLRREASSVLVDACLAAGVARFVQESFAPAYPDHGERWIDESTPLRPVRYNRTLADAEAAAGRFTRSGGAGVVLRFGAFYGPDAIQTADLIRGVAHGRALLPGPPGAYISSVSHDDAAAAAAAAISLPAGVYNVVDDEPVTHRALVDSLASALQVGSPRLPPEWLTPLFGSLGALLARSVRVANHKLRAASGWAPKYPSVHEGWAAVVGATALADEGRA